MERDKKGIGLTPDGQAILAEIEERGWFMEGQDIARFCMAYAIRAGVSDGTVSAGVETRWAIGNFDETGEIRTLVSALYRSCDTPVRQIEFLVNEGLSMVVNRIRSDAVGPAELIN